MAISNIVLPGEPERALSVLNSAINDVFTLIVVLGKGAAANTILAECYKRINSGKPFYRSVRCVHIPDPSIVMGRLKQLHCAPTVSMDWNNCQAYIAISVSNKFNKIAAVYSTAGITVSPSSKIDEMIIRAQAADL